jgi:hypothetical protein
MKTMIATSGVRCVMRETSYNRGLMTSWRRIACCALVALAACAAGAAAQAGLATLSLTIMLPDGALAAGARVEVTPSGAGAVRTVTVDAARPRVALPLGAGSHRLRVVLGGYRVAEETLDLAPGVERRITVRLAPENGMGRSTVTTDRLSEPAYQTNLGPEWLRDLPSGRTVWSLLDTAHPFVITDRMDNGGLWSARAAKLGGSGPSWTQTQFSLDGLDVTDMRTGGVPAVYPDLGVFDAVQVETARLGVETAGPGLAIALIPKRPRELWGGTGEAFVTPGGWQPDPEPGVAPALGRYDHWTDASLAASGPITGRTGLFASIRGTHGGRLERNDPLELSNNVASLYAHLIGTTGADRELRITTALSRATRPFEGRARYADRDIDERGRSVLGQAAVEQVRGGQLLAVSGGFQRVSNEPQVLANSQAANIERLLDGPPLAYGDNANSISQRWTLAASVAPVAGAWLNDAHQLRLGGSVSGARVTNKAIFQPVFGELVDGRPARAWDIGYRGAQSLWTSTAVSAFAGDRWEASPRITVNAGLRFDHDSGSAEGAANGIGWTSALPGVTVRWAPRDDSPFTVTTGYSWYRERLPLDYLSVGDPNGPSGVVSRWDDRNGDLFFAPSELTPIAYVGSCCAGGVASVIDPDLKAPYAAEFFIGAEHRMGAWRMRMTGVDRRERNRVALVNSGVALGDYVTIDVPDSGIDVDGGTTAQTLRLYGRTPSMFGRDRYTLTNPEGLGALYQGVDITVDRELFRRWFFRFGGSAYRIKSTGANRGFLSSENDQGLLGEAFLWPNALTSAEGRSFFDRAFVIKLSGAYRAPGDVRIGMVARYQDGLPFSRMVLTDAFAQGRDLVMAIPRGAQRFTYMFTLDAKVEKELTFGRRQVGVIVEAYNLTNATIEAEEYVVTGAAFRKVSAVQPPRAIRAGLRLGF